MSQTSHITAETEPAVLASRFINHTRKNIFLTGKAGTGKTTFLRKLVEQTHKKCVIVAPTGIAAINAGGVTIHSFFQLPFGAYLPFNQPKTQQQLQLKINDPQSLVRHMQMQETKRKIFRGLELLIIDEVSMLRADLLDAMEMMLRFVRKKNMPFGGVQVLFIGDLLQLPPVVKNEEWEILKQHYKSIHFFEAQCLRNEKPVYIELEKVYRQADDAFINLLNNLRRNEIGEYDLEILNRYYKPNFRPKPDENYITLTTHNSKALELNKTFLQELKGRSYFFEANVENEFNEYSYPVEKTIELKQGAQLMFVKNDPTGAQRFFNGRIAVVSSINEEEIEVEFEDKTKLILEKYEWQNIKYGLNETTNEIEENISGTFTQYPVKLAWAITVHKSQGLTFDKAIIDIGSAFAPGQAYVALSRLRSLDGLVLTSNVRQNGLLLDHFVAEFSKTKTEQENLTEQAEKESAVFLQNYLAQCFDLGPLAYSLKEHLQSYKAEETRSARHKHAAWAEELERHMQELKVTADKFQYQLQSILSKKEADHLAQLNSRITKAKEYFQPFLQQLSKSIFDRLEIIKQEKKVKAYVEELLSLEVMFFEQSKSLSKAEALAKAVLEKKEFSRHDINYTQGESERKSLLERLFSAKPKEAEEPAAKPARERKKRDRKPKTEKPDTKFVTFNLYKEGKNISEISALRNMTSNTIEGHIAHFVAKGEVGAAEFINDAKQEKINAAIKELDTFILKPLKEKLGADFSYGEIKLGIAAYLLKRE